MAAGFAVIGGLVWRARRARADLLIIDVQAPALARASAMAAAPLGVLCTGIRPHVVQGAAQPTTWRYVPIVVDARRSIVDAGGAGRHEDAVATARGLAELLSVPAHVDDSAQADARIVDGAAGVQVSYRDPLTGRGRGPEDAL